MKKITLTVVATAAVLAAVMVGPDLWDLYRLQKYIDTSARAYEANGGSWPQVSDACATCHGPNGNSVNQHYPSLAGQPALYVTEQLHRFASGQRNFPIMNAMARNLKQGDFDALAQYFARQQPSANRYFESDSKLKERGQQIVGKGACAACHGTELRGKDKYPRLAGLGYDYLLKQLNGFADGSRKDPANTMNALASAWSLDDRMAIATFLASHPIKGSETP